MAKSILSKNTPHFVLHCILPYSMPPVVYSSFVPDFIQSSVEQGLIEELVELLEIDSDGDVIMV